MQEKGIKKSVKTDRYQYHDYYNMDALLSEDHLLARDAVRDWVKQEVSPIIEEYSSKGNIKEIGIQPCIELLVGVGQHHLSGRVKLVAEGKSIKIDVSLVIG